MVSKLYISSSHYLYPNSRPSLLLPSTSELNAILLHQREFFKNHYSGNETTNECLNSNKIFIILVEYFITLVEYVPIRTLSLLVPQTTTLSLQVQHVTQNSSYNTHFTVTDIARTSFLGKLTFSNQEDGELTVLLLLSYY